MFVRTPFNCRLRAKPGSLKHVERNSEVAGLEALHGSWTLIILIFKAPDPISSSVKPLGSPCKTLVTSLGSEVS